MRRIIPVPRAIPLPAHRYEDRKKKDKKKDKKGKVWVFDFDETITTAPSRMRRLAKAFHKMGDTVVVLTGNESPRDQLVKRLTDDYKFPFDDLIQYKDEESGGLRRAAILKELNAWCGIDNRIDRGNTYAQVCPHLFLVAEPAKPEQDAADGAKKDAKKTVKKQRRSTETPDEGVEPTP